jgi:NAD(P)-dependent dehydrogenase (short-subunit alcohol dehydrogenase family)
LGDEVTLMSDAKKIALITGGNKGIGLETARQLGKLGITVLVGVRDLAKGEAAVTALKKDGVDARAVKLDVDNSADYEAVAKLIEKDYGVLDILINNAGIMLDGRKGNETSKTSQDVLRKTFNTNFFAVVGLTQALLPLLRKSLGGRIVNLSSILGSNTLHATPGSFIYDAKTFAYDASKAALNSFTIHLAHELKDTKIKVNSAHPGWVKTEMGGEGAQMEIVDGAKTSVRLAMLGEDGPSGGYFHMDEALPW